MIKIEATLISNSTAFPTDNSLGLSCDRLQIKGLENHKAYLIATKAIPSTFIGKLLHLLDWRWVEFTYTEDQQEKTVLVNKNSLIKRLQLAGITQFDIQAALASPSELSNFIHANHDQLKTSNSLEILEKFSQNINPLSRQQNNDLLEYWEKNKIELSQKALDNGGSIRIRPSESGLARTLLVTNENGIVKAFVLFNKKTDIVVGSGTCKDKISLCFEITQGKWCTHARFKSGFRTTFTDETNTLKEFRETSNVLHLEAANEYRSKKGQKVKKYGMITEWCNRGTLATVVESESFKRLSPEKKNEFCKKIAIALQEIHKKGTIHRDIKLQNIFVMEVEGELIPIIADFGHSYKMENDEERKQIAGSPLYMHPIIAKKYLADVIAPKVPEASTSKRYAAQKPSDDDIPQEALDIWALGLVFYMIHNQKNEVAPWKRMTTESSLVELSGYHTEKRIQPINTPDSINNPKSFDHLLRNMLQADPKNQWSLDQVIAFLE